MTGVLANGMTDACPECHCKSIEHLEPSGSVQGSEVGDSEKVVAEFFRRCPACGHVWIQDEESQIAS